MLDFITKIHLMLVVWVPAQIPFGSEVVDSVFAVEIAV